MLDTQEFALTEKSPKKDGQKISKIIIFANYLTRIWKKKKNHSISLSKL